MDGTPTTPAPKSAEVGYVALRICGIVFFLCLSGTIQALNLSFINQDIVELRCRLKDGTETEKKEANMILPLREKHTNYMVAAFIMATTACDATTVLLIGSLVNSLAAFFIGTILVTVFVNILPEALAFRYSSFVATRMIYLTYIVMIVMFPAAFPLSLFMNCFIKPHDPVRNREYLLAYIKLIMQETLEPFQLKTLKGTLTLQGKAVRQIMTPIAKVHSLSESDILDWGKFVKILRTGYSRVPIYRKEKQHIVGLLHIKEIAIMFGISRKMKLPVKLIIDKAPRPLNFVPADTALNRDSFVKSLKSGMHLAFVVDGPVTDTSIEKVMGIVTLEDMIEEMIGQDINDESDMGKVNSKDRRKGMMYAKQLIKALEKENFSKSPQSKRAR